MYKRQLVRFGLPVLLVAAVAGLVFYDESRRTALAQGFAGLRQAFEQRPEFRVSFVSIDGASPDLSDAVRAKLGLKLPQSSFDLDLDALRLKAEGLDAVQSAELRVRSGGVLQAVSYTHLDVYKRQNVAHALQLYTQHRGGNRRRPRRFRGRSAKKGFPTERYHARVGNYACRRTGRLK